MNPMGKMEDNMKKGLKDLMKNRSSAQTNSRQKAIEPKEIDLSMFDKLPKKAAGGMMKKKGYAKGGMMKKGYKKGGKVRGAGMASKGVRPAKMVTMKGA
jgi:hypothetical protein